MYEIFKVLYIFVDSTFMFENFFANPLNSNKKTPQMLPSYIKEDGTKVYEKDDQVGHIVYEISPDNVYISRIYNHKGQLTNEYARHKNLEIGRQYDEADRIVNQIDIVYDENNVQAMKKEYEYSYYDNGVKKTESVKEYPADIMKMYKFDENGTLTEMYEQRGSVKTWFDKDGKPIKREIDRGSGGIITEDLTKK